MIIEKTTLTIKAHQMGKEELKDLLEETKEIKKNHPDIVINIEVIWP